MAKGKNKNKNKGGKNEVANQTKTEEVENQENQSASQNEQKVEEVQQTATTMSDISEVKTEEKSEQQDSQVTQTANSKQQASHQPSSEPVEQVVQAVVNAVETKQAEVIPTQQQNQAAQQQNKPEQQVVTIESAQKREEEKDEVKEEDGKKQNKQEKQEKFEEISQEKVVTSAVDLAIQGQNKNSTEDIQINIETSADFQELTESIDVQTLPQQVSVPTEHTQQQQNNQQQKNVQQNVPSTLQQQKPEVKVEQPQVEQTEVAKVEQIDETQNKVNEQSVPVSQAQQTVTIVAEQPSRVEAENPLFQQTEIVQTQVVYVDESYPIVAEQSVPIQTTVEAKNQEQKGESLLISESEESTFIRPAEVQHYANIQNVQPHKVIQQLHENLAAIQTHLQTVQTNQVQNAPQKQVVHQVESIVVEVKKVQENEVKIQQSEETPLISSIQGETHLLVESQPLLIDSHHSEVQTHPNDISPIQILKNQLRTVESVIIKSATLPVDSTVPAVEFSIQQTVIAGSSQISQPQPTNLISEEELERRRKQNQEEQEKRKKLKQQQQHLQWTRIYEEKRKRQEEQRRRHEEEMRRVKEEEERKRLRQEKEKVEKQHTELKKNLEEIKQIKKDVDNETPLPVKIGISVAASVVVGGAAWFGLHNKSVTAVGALASLAIAFVAQK